ncbi:MAG: ammonium transporter [Planctomycetales bacterium]|nr:ammonium transporter [Planctomycetales bacterium]
MLKTLKFPKIGIGVLSWAAFAASTFAQEEPALDSGDTAWILTSTALVLFMTIPALALFYGGLVRTKNVLSVLMQCLVLTAVLSIVWVVIGYSLAFDSTGMVKDEVGARAVIGTSAKAMMKGITGDTLSGTIPEVLFAAFQMTFAVITPALMIGAFAERMKFSAVLVFSTVWLFVVYIPVCHMTWAGEGGLFADWGVMDFAGGIVVHVTAGFAALAACIVIGPRHGYPTTLEPPHNMTMTVTGTAMLWVGWFGFNAGSALGANGQAAMTLLVTHLSASVATFVWMAIEWLKLGKPSVLGAATGAIAGLAAITPASGFVGPLGAIAIGTASAIICFIFATTIKQAFKYDDTLDVFGVHGVGGFLGTILCGVFASTQFGGSVADLNIAKQVGVQFTAAAITGVYAIVVSLILLKIIQATIGLRIPLDGENRGLDLTEHDERGYIFN